MTGRVPAVGRVPIGLPRALFDFNAAATPRFTFSGSSIETYSHNGWTLTNHNGNRIQWGTTAPIAWSPTVRLTRSPTSRLYTTEGRALGDFDHVLIAVARRRGPVQSSTYGHLFMMGQIDQGSSVVGELATGSVFGGGYGNTTPFAPLPAPPAASNGAMILAKTHRAGQTCFLADAHPSKTTGDVVVANGSRVKSTAQALNISSGFGFDPIVGVSNEAPCEWDLARAIVAAGAFTLRDLQLICKRVADWYELGSYPPLLLAVGDSITRGTDPEGAQIAESYPFILEQMLQPTHPGAVVINNGVNGWYSAQIGGAVDYAEMCTNHSAPRAVASIALISAGLNDFKASTDPAIDVSVVVANQNSMADRAAAAGMLPVLVLLTPPDTLGAGISPTTEDKRLACNEYQRVNGLTKFAAIVDVQSSANVAKWGDLKEMHPAPGDLHYGPAGYYALGGMVADAVLELLAAVLG